MSSCGKYKAGDYVEGLGVYFKTLKTVTRKQWDFFAAPRDLNQSLSDRSDDSRLALPYAEMVETFKGIELWEGLPGAQIQTEHEIKNALMTGSADIERKWMIPTLALLNGDRVNSPGNEGNSILQHKDAGRFKNSFNEQSDQLYMTCSHPRGYPNSDQVYGAFVLPDRSVPSWQQETNKPVSKNKHALPVRPVCAVLRRT